MINKYIYSIAIALLISFNVFAGPCFSSRGQADLNPPGAEGGEETEYSSSFDKKVKQENIDQSDLTKVRDALKERELQVQVRDENASGLDFQDEEQCSASCSFNAESAFLDFQYGESVTPNDIFTSFSNKVGIDGGTIGGRTDDAIVLSVRSLGIDWRPNLLEAPLSDQDWERLDELYDAYETPLSDHETSWYGYLRQPGGIRDTLKIRVLSEPEVVTHLENTKLNSSSILSGDATTSAGEYVGHTVTVTKIGEGPGQFVVNDNLFAATSLNGNEIMNSQEVVDFITESVNEDIEIIPGEYRNSYTLMTE